MRNQLSIPTMMIVLARTPNCFAESIEPDHAGIVAGQVYRPNSWGSFSTNSMRRWRRAVLIAMTSLIGTGSVSAQAVTDGAVDSASPAFQNAYVAATKAKDPAAMAALGVMYDQGMGVVSDPQEAFQWYLRAAATGDAESMNRLGLLYCQGCGVPQDFVAAKSWYLQAAANGSTDAANNMATLYFYGLGVPQDYAKAAQILTQVAQQRDPAAMNKLGAMLQDGLGVKKNPAMARELFQRAAAQGYPPAMMNLGRTYANSHQGRQADMRGYSLLRAAIDRGLPGSMMPIAYYELGAAAARLNPQELKKAQDLAATIVESNRADEAAPEVHSTSTSAPVTDGLYVSLRKQGTH